MCEICVFVYLMCSLISTNNFTYFDLVIKMLLKAKYSPIVRFFA